jgi:hypothetical protein
LCFAYIHYRPQNNIILYLILIIIKNGFPVIA